MFTSGGRFLRVFGHGGAGRGEFHLPCCVAVDPTNGRRVYVTDTGNSRIEKFTRNGRFLRAWGSKGSGRGQFNQPQGIAVDADGRVYVADDDNGRIEKFTAGGVPGAWGARARLPASSNIPAESRLTLAATSTSPTPVTTGSRSFRSRSSAHFTSALNGSRHRHRGEQRILT